MSKLYYNARVVTPVGMITGYVGVDGDRIAAVGEGVPDVELLNDYAEAEDLHGCLLMPGVIDDQVHFRDPGLTHKGDIETESRAAIAGGVTSVMDMPNTKPQTVTVDAWQQKMNRAAICCASNYAFFIGATSDNIEELRRADYSHIPGIKLFLGASTGNMLVTDEKVLDDIFSLGRLVAIHSEDEATIRNNVAAAREKYGEGNVPIAMHPLIRSEEACVKSTRRAIERARRLSTRLHVLHLSTAAELEFLSADALDDKKITAEVCVHHLWFTDQDYAQKGSLIKWNPAVKTEADRDALRKALLNGKIDIVATDHAPHLLSEKEGDALNAASGGPMVQYSLLVMLELSRQGMLSLERVAQLMSANPANLFGIKDRGEIREGAYADLVVVDTSMPHTVTRDDVISKCGWSPLEGTTFSSTVKLTIINGKEAWRDGRFIDTHAGKPLEFRGCYNTNK